MRTRCIEPARSPVNAELTAVPSKSWTHRALVAAALADGRSRVDRPLDAADTRCTRRGIVSLGLRVEDDEGSWVVHGGGGRIPGGARIDCEASGTTARFLSALAATGSRPSVLDGSPRLRERPMEELVTALGALGAFVSAPGGGLPLEAGGPGLHGGSVTISGRRSSQFASALLLVGPALADGLELTVAPPRASFAYVLLTTRVLEQFGVIVRRTGDGTFLDVAMVDSARRTIALADRRRG